MIVKDELPCYIKNLISKIEKANDFGYDDEEIELSKWCKSNKFYWCWNDSLFDPEILITKNVFDIKNMCVKRKINMPFDIKKEIISLTGSF